MKSACLHHRAGPGGSSSAGLTLPEVLLAAVLMVLAILPVVGIFRTGIGGQHAQIRRMGAVQVAQDFMNRCLAANWNDLTTAAQGATHQETLGGVSYNITIGIEDLSSISFSFMERAPVPTDPPVVDQCTIADALKKITVEARWSGTDTNKTLSFKLISFKSKIQTD